MRETPLGFCLRVIVNANVSSKYCTLPKWPLFPLTNEIFVLTHFQLSDFDNLIAKEFCTFLVFLNYTSAGYLKFCKFFCIFEMAWSRAFQKCIFYDFLDIFLQTFLLCITGFWRKPFFWQVCKLFSDSKSRPQVPCSRDWVKWTSMEIWQCSCTFKTLIWTIMRKILSFN